MTFLIRKLYFYTHIHIGMYSCITSILRILRKKEAEFLRLKMMKSFEIQAKKFKPHFYLHRWSESHFDAVELAHEPLCVYVRVCV